MEKNALYETIKNIAHCPYVKKVLESEQNITCEKIVKSQNVPSIDNFQVPEPWRGHIDEAKILFVSSNPSISSNEEFPTWNWEMESIQDFFINCFDENSKYVKDGTRHLKKNGIYSSPVKFWSEVKNRAQELIDDAIPGKDYALTEIVHCKSKKQEGVSQAQKTCSQKYLKSVVALSTAKVIIILGEIAKEEFCTAYNIPNNDKALYGPLRIEDVERYIVFLPHPNARVPRKIEKVLTNQEIKKVKKFINVSAQKDVKDGWMNLDEFIKRIGAPTNKKPPKKIKIGDSVVEIRYWSSILEEVVKVVKDKLPIPLKSSDSKGGTYYIVNSAPTHTTGKMHNPVKIGNLYLEKNVSSRAVVDKWLKRILDSADLPHDFVKFPKNYFE